jgi:hypothetical protein
MNCTCFLPIEEHSMKSEQAVLPNPCLEEEEEEDRGTSLCLAPDC